MMDIATLEALGVNREELVERIIDQAVNALLSSSGFDPDSEEEVTYESKFKREINARIQKAVDQKIGELAEKHLIPHVGEMIETADMRKTNRFGEPTSPPLTFKEYIAERAEQYMSEDVDMNCKSKSEGDSYNWRASGPRLTVLMTMYIRSTLEDHAKKAVTDVNKVIAKNIENAAKSAIRAAAESIKVSVS